MRKMIALMLVLSLLLCGCGGKEEAQSVAASEAPVSEVASEVVEEPSVEEVSVVEEQEIPEDPEELGKWVYALSDSVYEEIASYDADVSVNSELTVNEMTTPIKITGRVKELVAEDGTITYYSSTQLDGLTTDVWFADGIAYQSDLSGSFKAPMEQEAFLEEYSMLKEIEGTDETTFGLLTAEVTDKGYAMTYDQLSPAGEQSYMDFHKKSLEKSFGESGLEVEITGIAVNGVSEMDKNGFPIRDDQTTVMTFTVGGVEYVQESNQTIIYNKTTSDLIIDIPADDETFKETTDLNVADYFMTGFNSFLFMPALQYESAIMLTVADGTTEDTYVATDVITYTMASGALAAKWETREYLNDEVVYSVIDEYANGEGTLTYPDGVEPYYYDDATFLSDVIGFLGYSTDSFDYGISYTLEPQGEETVLTYEVEAEYAEMAIEDYLAMYMPEYSLAEADSVESSGSMEVRFDGDGLITAQTLNCVCEADFGGIILTFTLNDTGVVLATGGDVVLSGAAS